MASLLTLFAQDRISYGGMEVDYERVGDSLEVKLRAPTQGWLALGFNEQNDIVGSDLKMMAVAAGKIIVDDQWVTAPGVHPSDETMAGHTNIRVLSAEEADNFTQFHLRLPLVTSDKNDLSLKAGQSLWLIMAYSVSDDFDHHSRMRKHFLITL
ncbi:MAG: DOMON domain-containing protein [Bacteroidota bacterium]